ncbi:MAG: D-proline reductase (dithiol) proprotein PrdA [Tissierellaceae bacterium]|nr:D-proline reductase (dithiol) proprotein PrdA [Tissierellaceae bacterium]
MSLSIEQAEKFKREYAILCCRLKVGSIIDASHLEDPSIFPDLVDSGLLTIPNNCSRIGEVIGAKLLKTTDALSPLTSDILDGIKELEPTAEDINRDEYSDLDKKAVLKYNMKSGDLIKASDFENPMNFEKLEDSLLIKLSDEVLTIGEVVGKKLNRNVVALTPITPDMLEGFKEIKDETLEDIRSSGVLKIKIAEGKGIDIEIPMGGYIDQQVVGIKKAVEEKHVEMPAKEVRKLTKKYFKIDEVKFGKETKIEGTTLYIRENIEEDALKVDKLVKKIKIDIITPDRYNEYSETIMDVQPIATKEEGYKLGTGITRVLDGVIMMVTGTDENGIQIGEFGSSEGILEENIMWGRPGAPDKGEIFIKTEVVIKEHTNMERPGPLAAHKATDYITGEIREALKKLEEGLVVKEEEFIQYKRVGKKKVVIVKEIMGQGAMHDNLILPMEPVGVLGGKPNVDLGNVPIVCSPLEILDGAIHALTCIGPASKECSRHYFREPLIIEALKDEDIDLCGVVLVGSPQINTEKFYVSERLGMTVEAMDVDGAMVTTEGFGNNHIDFASHIEQIGIRGISVVGASFCGVQGALVVGNKYMTNMIDLNKTKEGIENEVLACNTLTQEDGLRILVMLKAVMDGEEILSPERKWNPKVKEKNLGLIKNKVKM